MNLAIYLFLIALAGLIGFYADRTGICTVKAVEEILTTRRAWLLLSFGKTILWVIGTTICVVWWLGAATPEPLGFGITLTSLAGGLLFGIGAVCNGGCAFQTIKRLGNGNLGTLITLTGFVAGVALFDVLARYTVVLRPVPASPWVELRFGFATALGVVIAIWMIWEVFRLWRSASGERGWSKVYRSRYRLSTAAAIIGVTNGIIYSLLGTWSYTHTLRHGVNEFMTPETLITNGSIPPILWWLFLALVAGVVVSSLLNRRFQLRWRPEAVWHAYFWGGVLMGFGAAMVPGGNDVILLNSIPGMSQHAIPAYATMLVGVLAGLAFIKWRGGSLDVIDCSGDICMTHQPAAKT